MATDTNIFRTTAKLKEHGYVTAIIPKPIRRALNLTEGDTVDIAIMGAGDNNLTHASDFSAEMMFDIASMRTRDVEKKLDKMKYIKKTIRELQTFHTDGKSYVDFKDLVENTVKAGIDKDELELRGVVVYMCSVFIVTFLLMPFAVIMG